MCIYICCVPRTNTQFEAEIQLCIFIIFNPKYRFFFPGMSLIPCVRAFRATDSSLLQNLLLQQPELVRCMALYEWREIVHLLPLIHILVLEQRVSHIATLLDFKADINASCVFRQSTALMHATYTQNVDIVHLLLRRNADVNARDHKGNTALHHALLNNSFSCLQLMLSHATSLMMPVFEHNAAIFHVQNNNNGASFAHVTRRYADIWMPMLQDKIDAFKVTMCACVFDLDVLDLIESWVCLLYTSDAADE